MRKDFGAKTYAYPMPVLMIGTYDENGNPDLMAAAWGCIADYDKIGIYLALEHKTTANVKNKKAFTVSMATEKTVVESDFVGIVSANDDKDKMKKSGLHAFKSNKVDAPMFEEYPLTLECEFESLDEETGLLVGKIINASVDESILTDGKVDICKLHAICYDPTGHGYYVADKLVGHAFKDGLKLK
ncbi:MAG: flavin reductase [Bacilli bacterium]|nr:flavin reductase [Bacilli bacterium]